MKKTGLKSKRIIAGTILAGMVFLLFSACPNSANTRSQKGGEEPGAPIIEPPIIEPPIIDPPIVPLPEPGTEFEVGNGSITVDVSPPAAAASYEIYRAGSRLGQYTLIQTSSGPSFTDTNPNPNKYENWYKIVYKNSGGQTISEELKSLELEIFGPAMLFYDAQYDKVKDIEAEMNRIHDDITFGSVTGPDGKKGEFTTYRHAMYFKPGTYGTRGSANANDDRYTLKVGFYTHLGGLGRVPKDTILSSYDYDTINTPAHLPKGNATCTFWRSIENFQIGGAFSGWEGRFHWGVSQAAPARRMKVYTETFFQDSYGDGDDYGWASGGFSADCDFREQVESYSQQQWYARNCNFQGGPFIGVNWNKVIQGSTGQVEADAWDTGHGPALARTKIDTTPAIREKPFLFIDTDGEYKVFVPALRREAQGVSWTDTSMGPGEAIDLRSKFYIAKAKDPNGKIQGGDTAATLNAALMAGKHIFFTPGRYELEAPLHVRRSGTILLGTGYATLIPGPGNSTGAVFVEDIDDVTVAGLLFDALYNSTYLLCVGDTDAAANHSANPALLADLVLRVGGFSTAHVNVDIAILINSNHVIGDQFWVWRADHGLGIGWDMNTSKNGVIVQGDDVTLYGLFVEHFQEYQTLWLGERGRTYFYQNESPYDPPNQAAYLSHNGTVNGYSSYKVANNVNEHYAVGLGIYPCFIQTNQPVLIQNAIEVPNKPGVTIKHACTVNISVANGRGAASIVNGTGNSNAVTAVNREVVASYSNGTALTPSANKTGTQPSDEAHNIPANLRP